MLAALKSVVLSFPSFPNSWDQFSCLAVSVGRRRRTEPVLRCFMSDEDGQPAIEPEGDDHDKRVSWSQNRNPRTRAIAIDRLAERSSCKAASA